MLKIVRQHLQVRFDAAQAFEFQKQIDGRLNPLISGVRREYFKRLGVTADDTDKWLQREQRLSTSPLVLADIVARDSDTVMYYRLPRGEGHLEAGVVTRMNPADYADFFDDLLRIARKISERKDLAWTPAESDVDLTADLADETVVVVPDESEVEASRALENDAAQRMMKEFVSSGSVFLTKFTKDLEQDRTVTERLVQEFENLGVIGKDYAVLCRKTGQQILRVSSRAAIEDPSQKTFKCFICGNSVGEELLDEIITVTDFGRKLLDNDYWLVVRVLGALQSVGIPNQQVHVHSGEPGMSSFFVPINGQLHLIVLVNRKIRLEEAHLISAHVAAYHLGNVIVISTEHVSTLMRNHLEKSNAGCEFDFLDSLQGLEENLSIIFARKEKAVLRALFDNFSAVTPVHVQDIVLDRISPDSEANSFEGRRRKSSRGSEKFASEAEKPSRRGKSARDESSPSNDDRRSIMSEEALEVDEGMLT